MKGAAWYGRRRRYGKGQGHTHERAAAACQLQEGREEVIVVVCPVQSCPVPVPAEHIFPYKKQAKQHK